MPCVNPVWQLLQLLSACLPSERNRLLSVLKTARFPRLDQLLSLLEIKLRHDRWLDCLERGDFSTIRRTWPEIGNRCATVANRAGSNHANSGRGFRPLPSLLDKKGELEPRSWLASGSTSHVLAAWHHGLKREVAVKLWRRDHVSSIHRQEFFREVSLMGCMHHPQITRVLGAGISEDGLPFLVMPLLHGPSLTRFCDQTQFALVQRISLLLKLMPAVAAIHAMDMVHGDLKPGNILVTQQNGIAVPVIMDFGAAVDLKQARPGRVGGTWPYAAPEKLLNQEDCRSDIYALGVLLLVLICRENLDNTTALPPGEGCDPALLHIVRRAIALNPADRYPSLSNMASDLSVYLPGLGEAQRGSPGKAS